MTRFARCNCPAGVSAPGERHAPDCPSFNGITAPMTAMLAASKMKPQPKSSEPMLVSTQADSIPCAEGEPMSAPIKRYDSFGYDGLSAMMIEDQFGDYVRLDDHLATHAFDEEKEREFFEAWHTNEYPDSIAGAGRFIRDGHSYWSVGVNSAWKHWLACARSRAERFAGGAE